MDLQAPYVGIRPPNYPEYTTLCDLVKGLWGEDASERCYDQFVEYFKGGKYAPKFLGAVNDKDEVIGFAAYHRTMQCTYNVIWLGVTETHRGQYVGRQLMQECLGRIEENEGMLVEVITQEKEFYQKLGFFQVHHLGGEWYLMLKPLGEFGL